MEEEKNFFFPWIFYAGLGRHEQLEYTGGTNSGFFLLILLIPPQILYTRIGYRLCVPLLHIVY